MPQLTLIKFFELNAQQSTRLASQKNKNKTRAGINAHQVSSIGSTLRKGYDL